LSKKQVYIFTHIYPPDEASVGQHIADVAEKMVSRGWQVNVFTSNRGYDNQKVVYPKIELRNCVQVRRFAGTSFGKSNLFLRVFGQINLLFQSLTMIFRIHRPNIILVSTSLVFVLAPLFRLFRGVPYVYWVMDLNPDQVIALGVLKENDWRVWMMNFMQQFVLRYAHTVITLDKFMAKRVDKKVVALKNHQILPPWAHTSHLDSFTSNTSPFRIKHQWENRRVLMFSGNHSLVHPLTTFLNAMEILGKNEECLLMAFIGGGIGKLEVEQWIQAHPNYPVFSLPYQPFEEISYSLSAADVHLVSMGDKMAGCVHPCKVYGAMSVGRPILLLGNQENHIFELIKKHDIGWQVEHGDVEKMKMILNTIRDLPIKKLTDMGQRAVQLSKKNYNQSEILGQFCDWLEAAAVVKRSK
jgi:colanic acid biosynthesis glycosyl transferase WcaI